MPPKPKKVITLKLPAPIPDVKEWVIVSADLSLTRTGVSVSRVYLQEDVLQTEWRFVGSIKPSSSSDSVWARSKAIALFIKDQIRKQGSGIGLILCLEQPPPQNDFLASINKILHTILLDQEISQQFSQVHILSINASSLRSALGLTMRGAKNKVENIARAYDFIDKRLLPELDTDSCDSILLTVMARYVASLLFGVSEGIPDKIKQMLCDSTQIVKGAGRNARILTQGILWRPAYWVKYTPENVCLKIKDASKATKKLQDYDILI